MELFEKLNFDEKGLIPAIVQDAETGQVLTLCYMDKEALKKTLEDNKIYVFRRSKGRVAMKGEVSGCTQEVKGVYVDCLENSLLFKVNQIGGACHKGYFTCFFRRMIDGSGNMLVEDERVFNPEEIY